MAIKFDAEDKSLQSILCGEEKYRIPRYQRPYSWSQDEVSDFWNDLKSNEASFLGSFIFNYEFYEKDKLVEIIDGQQRFITLTILMAVIRDLYKELGDDKKAGLTQTSAIAFQDIIYGEETYRLKCSDSLSDYFIKNIQSYESNVLLSEPKNSKEEKNVKENYEYLRTQIKNELKTFSEKSKKTAYLDELRMRIFDLKVIWVKIEKDEDAYSIFETVNARGEDLTAADLLKNYIFQKIPKDSENNIDKAKEFWTTIENNIEGVRGSLTLSKFIRYFWLSKYSFVTEKGLYREIKKTITNPEMLLTDLQKASEFYSKMLNSSGNWEVWNDDFEDKKISQKITETLNGLRIMRITQCYSLMLCLLMNKDKIQFDFSNIFKTIERHHFAYSAVCKQPGNVVEKLYHKTAAEIQNAFEQEGEKRLKNIQRALSNFKNTLKQDFYPSREFFIEKFMDIEYKDYQLIIYILSSIERAKGETDEMNINFTKVNIEHILPQDPINWKLKRENIKNFVNNLGNLTLIAKKINGPMGNKPLKEKVKWFKESKLNINKDLVKDFEYLDHKWEEREIKDRQRKLAEFAYDVVWRFE